MGTGASGAATLPARQPAATGLKPELENATTRRDQGMAPTALELTPRRSPASEIGPAPSVSNDTALASSATV